ncbi:hypothetical protein M8J77_026374 [Diaphorina citri]|nr:hypothetical protein M8J77_026374 [Diaphorina citri]
MVAMEDLDKDQIALLKRAFDAFAQGQGFIEASMVGGILQMLGHDLTPARLEEIIKEVDADGNRHQDLNLEAISNPLFYGTLLVKVIQLFAKTNFIETRYERGAISCDIREIEN